VLAVHICTCTCICIYRCARRPQVPEGYRKKDYEESELVLYKHSLLASQGLVADGLAWLDASKDWVVDQLG
jgi:hypothetical protein